MRLCAAVLASIAVAVWAGPAQACPGDCDSSGHVSIDELLRGVNIALDRRPVSDCSACDTNGSGAVEVAELIAAVNAALRGCPVTPTVPTIATPTATPTQPSGVTPIFPASYRNTYVEVRDCRFSVEHGGVAIRVLANPIAVQPYLNEENPLPVGSIIVKEEYDASGCSDDTTLVRWRAMRKEAPGFDSEHGDWHWQWVQRDRSVPFDDKTTCIGCHLAEECVARDYMCTHDSGQPTLPPLRLIFDGLSAALLGVAGTSPTNVWVVGADPNDGLGPYVLQYNGQCWKRLRTGASGALWWISFKPIDGAFYMVGDGGLILRYDIATGEFERQTAPNDDVVLFGVWGARSDNIWAVGDNSAVEGGGGVIWHYDGQSWQPVDLTGVVPGGVPTLFKIWGRSDNDVYVVGRAGVILHFDGQRWTQVDSGTVRPLFSVHGNDDIVVATGGFVDGVVVENDGTGFVDRTPRNIRQINGIFVPPDGSAVGLGVEAAVALRDADGWAAGISNLETPRDFHAVWIDPEGGVWGVGGDLSVNLSSGVLVYGGSRTVPTEITPHCGSAATAAGRLDVEPLLGWRGADSLSRVR